MARRPTPEERWKAAKTLADQPLTDVVRTQVRTALTDASNLVVAAGAAAAKAHRLTELISDLLTAYDRHFIDPVERDPRCHAKLALVEALDELGHDDEAVWLRAIRHVQPEPVWGGSEDSAPGLRIRGAQALTGRGHPDLFLLLGDLLADHSGEVRVAAAQMLGSLGSERATVLLRLRLRLTDARPELIGDYAAALLAADGPRALDLVGDLLRGRDPLIVEGIALALGESRCPGALPLLSEVLTTSLDHDARRALVMAISLLRSDEAAEALLRLVADAPPALAGEAITGLRFYRERGPLMTRLRTAVDRRAERALTAKLQQMVAGD